jgi:hypothetical protein
MIKTSYSVSRHSLQDKHMILKDLQQANAIGAKHRRKIAGKKVRTALDSIALGCNIVIMSVLRDAILKRMKELHVTTYRLSKMVEGKVCQRTVYTFISGEADARSEVVSALMQALDLEITVKGNVRRSKRSRK